MLSKICGPDDVLTSLAPFDERFDADYYEFQPRNNEGFENHMSASEIKKRLVKGYGTNTLRLLL
jgi:hypothetical protein